MPIIDADHLGKSAIRADVCVIGGGPAGIVVAAELSAAGRDVVVLEAGGLPYDRHALRNARRTLAGHARGSQAGTRGSNRGDPYYPLRMSRARGIGGSTQALKAHGLRSRPLDAIDFSGPRGDRWPLPFSEYASFLDAAATYCGIPGKHLSWDAWDPGLWGGSSSDVAAVGFRHGDRDALAALGIAGTASPRERWIIDAVVTRLLVDTTGHVAAVEAKSPNGSDIVVHAGAVVMATGGIDNARLLLANESVLAHMGPAADQVGRSFMEHLHYVSGFLTPASDAARRAIAACFAPRDGIDPWLTLSDAATGDHAVGRSAYAAVPAYGDSLQPAVSAFGRLSRIVPFGPFDKGLWKQEARTIVSGGAAVPRALAARILRRSSRESFVLTAMSEQEPNPRSRVTLGDRTDRFNLRLPVLEWRLTEQDLRSVRSSAEILGRNLAAAGLGTFYPASADADPPSAVFTGGWHHMGTTRMSEDPAVGVVDAECRVHGVSNLFVAGSSVFPSGGFANPTLSIVALSIRLAGHLADRSG